MDFSQTEERRMLVDTVRRYLAETYPMAARHTAAASEIGFDRDRWMAFAELGLIGALFSEDTGGYGGTGPDILTVFEELGRGLVVEPFLATLMAGTALSDDAEGMEELIGGRTLAAFAHFEPDSRYDGRRISTSVSDGGRITGHKSLVLNGDAADILVVSVKTEAGYALFRVDATDQGISRRGYPTVDGMHAAEIVFDRAPAKPLGRPGDAWPTIERLLGLGLLALSAEALGAMTVCADMTVDYMKTRKQFGRPIGQFQALRHRLVDVLIEIDQARSSVINAASRLTAPRTEREWALSAAKAMAGKSGKLVAEETIQLHGGIAMTWDYPLGHYAKRLIMIDHCLGDTDYHLERAAHLSLTPL